MLMFGSTVGSFALKKARLNKAAQKKEPSVIGDFIDATCLRRLHEFSVVVRTMSAKREIDEVEEDVDSGNASKMAKVESNGGKAKDVKDSASPGENGAGSDAEDDDDKSDTEKDEEIPSVPVEIPEKEKGVGSFCTFIAFFYLFCPRRTSTCQVSFLSPSPWLQPAACPYASCPEYVKFPTQPLVALSQTFPMRLQALHTSFERCFNGNSSSSWACGGRCADTFVSPSLPSPAIPFFQSAHPYYSYYVLVSVDVI